MSRFGGTRSTRGGVGAQLRFSTGATTQRREVTAGSGYLGESDLRVHVGLGAAARVDRLEIRWPTRVVERIDNVAANQIVTVTEGKGVTARTPFARP